MSSQPSLFYIPRLNSLPLRERPAYRVGRFGPGPLSTHELLAAVIGGDRQLETAWTLLERYGSLRRLAQASVDELAQVPGIGPARAAALKAALALGQRMNQEALEERPKVPCLVPERSQAGGRRCDPVQGHIDRNKHPGGGSFPGSRPAELRIDYRRSQPPVGRPDTLPGGCGPHPHPGKGWANP